MQYKQNLISECNWSSVFTRSSILNGGGRISSYSVIVYKIYISQGYYLSFLWYLILLFSLQLLSIINFNRNLLKLGFWWIGIIFYFLWIIIVLLHLLLLTFENSLLLLQRWLFMFYHITVKRGLWDIRFSLYSQTSVILRNLSISILVLLIIVVLISLYILLLM